METRTKYRVQRALWIALPALAVAAFALPRALAWGHHHQAATSPAELAEHLEFGLDHLLDKVDASDAQRDQANAIAERRAPELFAVVEQARQVRGKLKQVLLADKLDRTELADAQVQLNALAAQASQIGLSTVFEVSEVLTPAQRKQVADRMARFER
ncbi:MAG: hypothetical protein JWN48_5328 [Myxococcaceae bacterium]|nr:hypothetical protein [Myxococcaceae bacterium]